MKKILAIIVCTMLSVAPACVKQQTYSIIPALTAITVSRTQFNFSNASGYTSDSVLVTMNFTDGDGDIGSAEQGATDTTTIILCNHAYDNRAIADPFYNVFYYTYHYNSVDSCLGYIQTAYVPNSAKNNSVMGTIQVYPGLECPATGTVDTVWYSFFITDRAGHISNRLRTPKIAINCN